MRAAPLVTLSPSRTVVLASDIHWGAIDHAEKEWDEASRWIVDHRAKLVVGGDIINNATPDCKEPGEHLMNQSTFPNEQYRQARDKLKPLAKRGLLVAILMGNHDQRTRRVSMFDVIEVLADELGVPYLADAGLIRFQAGEQVYTGGIHHGRSGARSWAYEVKRMLDLYPRADFVAAGHNHRLRAEPRYYIDVGADGLESACSRQWLIRTGSYQYYGGFPRSLNCEPDCVGSPVLTFESKRHDIDVDLRTLAWAPR